MSISQYRSQELDVLVKITEILTGQSPFVEKCESVLAVLARFTDSESVILREFDPENSTFSLLASYFGPLVGQDFQVPLSITSSLLAETLETNSPILVNDYFAFEQASQEYYSWGMKCALAVPIYVDGEPFGTLGFGSTSIDHYQEERVPVVAAIAASVGMMIAKAELQEDNEVEANIGRIVSSPLVGQDVFEGFAAEASRIVEFDRLSLSSVNVRENTCATEFLLGGQVPAFFIGENRSLAGTAIEKIVRSGSSQRISLDERMGLEAMYPNGRPFVAAGLQFFLGVPFVVGDQVIGILGFNRGSRPFAHKDLTKAERLGILVAGAFADFKQQQYRIHAETVIQKNREILEVEANIGRILSSPMGESDELETLRFEIARVIPLDRVVISAIDLETGTFSQDFNEFLRDAKLMFDENQGQSYAGTITAEVVRTGNGQIFHRGDSRLISGQLPRVQGMLNFDYKTMMAVPLVFEEKIIGTMILLSQREREFSFEDMAIAERIGNLLAGALATFKITAERNRAQQALSESEARFRQIADSVSGVFWLTGLDPHRLIYASPSAEDIWGMPLKDIYDDFGAIFENIHPDDRQSIREASARSEETGELDIEYRLTRRDGSVRWIHSRGFPVRDETGNIVRMAGIGEDITGKKKELERISEAGRLLSIGELASGVAHEINNPLANINLYAEGLLEQDLPAPVIKDLQVIFDQGKRAAAIVRKLLQFARKSSPEISTVSAKEFVEHCIELKSHEFRVNNISSSVDILMADHEIKIDENLMAQVVVNILTNAEQACVATSGRGQIAVTVREIEGAVRISIADDGPGISDGNLPKVFDPFFTTKEVGEGTGLGLSVSYGIIAQLGGNLWAESDGRTGSTFHIELPPVEPEKPSGNTGGLGSSDSQPARPLNVLVVDDEPDLRFILGRLVKRQGHTADLAGDGEEGWRKVQSQDYDCVLLDIRMAGTNGQTLFGKISSSYPDLAANVIFITGDLANAKTHSFLQRFDNPVLEKPISILDLDRALDSVSRLAHS